MELVTEYSTALKKYISYGGEIELHLAYELGRKALDEGELILNIFNIHSEVLKQVLNDSKSIEEYSGIVSSAEMFFTEFLSPFEMTFRGFLDVVANLKSEITIRKQAEEAYSKSEKYYRALIGNALDMITILDRQGYFKYYSPAVERVLGYNKDEMIGKNAFEYVHPSDVESVLETFRRLTNTPDFTTTVEFRFKHKDGSWIILESIGKNLISEPIINGVIVNSRDITDRRNLEEIRRKYEFIVNASKEMLALVNSSYKYEAVNEAFGAALSEHRIDIIGQHISVVLGEDNFNKLFKSHIDECFKGKEIIYEEWLTLPKSGKKFYEIAYYPYRSQRSEVTHVIIVQRDITERKRKEDELIASEIKYRRLFETSKEGLLLLDAATGIAIDVNAFVIELLGFPEEKLLGKKLWELDFVKDIPESQNALKQVTEKSYIRYDELELLTSVKRRVKVEFFSITYSVNNDKVIQCHLWDITERKLLQQELDFAMKQRAEDLRKFAQSIQLAQEEERKRISRELHDDICQRLTALKLHLNIFEDSISKQKKISIKRIKTVKKEIDDSINEVRRISSNLRPSALDHFGLVTAMKLLCSEFEKLHSIAVKFETGIQTFQRFNPEVEIVLYRIAQEALTNSVKHSKTKNILLNLVEESELLMLTISDKGKGFNVQDYFKKTQKSNGHFGLINMRERAELIGGKFFIESSLSKGTNVKVTIPIIKYANNEKN